MEHYNSGLQKQRAMRECPCFRRVDSVDSDNFHYPPPPRHVKKG
jgi:hypothetical protein